MESFPVSNALGARWGRNVRLSFPNTDLIGRFEVFTTANVRVTFYLYVTTCSFLDRYQQSPPSKRHKVIYHEDGGSNRGAKVSNYMESFEICSYSDIENSSLMECNAISNTNRNILTPHKNLISCIQHNTPEDGDEKLNPNLFISS